MIWTKGKVTEKDTDLKICPPVGQIDQKNVGNMHTLLSNVFGKCFFKSFRKNPPISARIVQKLDEMALFEPRKK